MENYTSSHTIIKALKGAEDPPFPGGPSKIEIARRAWESTKIPFLSKDEVLAEWILTSFVRYKDAGGPSGEGLVLSAEYWNLLSDILNADSPSPNGTQSRTWLPRLCIRISLLNVMTIFFRCARRVDLGHYPDVVNTFSRSVHGIWPQTAVRMNLEGLTECLGSVLEYFASDATRINDLASVCLLLTRSFKQAVGNSTGKKKAFSWFMERSFLYWVHLACLESSALNLLNRESRLFISEMCQAGVDVLFCLDSLKGPADPLRTILTDPRYSLPNLKETEYQIVPMLYNSYLNELQKHRFAVFGSGLDQPHEQTVQTKVRDAGMRAFEVCYRALRERGDHLEVWKNMLTLVQVLEQANIVGYGLTERTDVLNDVACSAVEVLTRSQDWSIEIVDAALQVLCAASRINFDFLSPILSDVLSGLLTMSPSVHPSTVSLLRVVLDFHSKMRTMPSYLELLLQTLSVVEVPHIPAVPRIHQCCTSGALLSLAHLGELSKSIRGFLTSGQAQSLVDSVLMVLRDAWLKYSEMSLVGQSNMGTEARERGTKTTRKKHDSAIAYSGPAPIELMERAALGFSLVARVVAVILPSLPFPSLSEAVSSSIKDSISSAWRGPVHEATQIAFSVPEQVGDRWTAQCVSAAALRMRHALLICPALHTANPTDQRIATAKNISQYIQSSRTIPELVVELLRAFFDADFITSSPEERDAVMDALMAYLETNSVVDVPSGQYETRVEVESSWDGWTSSLNPLEPGGHQRGALAIWQLLLDRWLPLVDEIASRVHLERIVKLLLTGIETIDNPTQYNRVTFQWSLERALQSAIFWELPNLRDAIISIADSVTQSADGDSFPAALKAIEHWRKVETPTLPTTWITTQIKSILGTFSTLLRAPKNYLPRSARITFIRRALVVDLTLSGVMREVIDEQTALARKTMIMIRAWILSISDTFDIIDIITVKEDYFREYVEYLLLSDPMGEGVDDDFHEITIGLLSNIFSEAVRFAVQSKPDLLKSLCMSLRSPTSRLSEQAILRFIEILVAEVPNVNKLSNPSKEAIGCMYSDMHAKYSEALLKMLSSMSEMASAQGPSVRSWRIVVVLRNWLNIQDRETYGIQLVQKLMAIQCHPASSNKAELFYMEVFLLLLEELNSLTGREREHHLSLIVATYVLFTGRLYLADHSTCDTALVHTGRSLSVDEFAHVLGLLREALKKGLASGDEIRAALHLSSILIGAAPEGSMRVTHEHFESCLHIFLDDSKFVTGDPGLSLEVLGFIGKMCSEKPAYLRHSTLGPIWLLLSKILTGSTTHTRESHPGILHSITTIAGSLIRLRRDLITSTLPHLGMVLTSLLRSLRAPRPQLGARQRTQVADTLPWWISPSTPLGLPEARAVARLLTTLQAKTTPRTFTSRDKAKKEKERTAESLLGAFSKHAPPVLGAYINALVDPLVVVDANMREALAPGLFALCDAMGEHGRDSLMVSGCDAAGRTVFKTIWKEYAKQRYVGRG